MTGFEDRIAAALDDDGLAPTPIGAIRHRTAARRRRRDVAMSIASVVAIVLGLTPLLLRSPGGSTAGPRSTALGAPEGTDGSPSSRQSCVTLGLDILVAHAGVAFVGRPVAERVESVPTTAIAGVPPDGAQTRVVWTFDDVSAVKGAVPRKADVTVDWLDAQGRPMTPLDPDAEFAANQGRTVGVLADRLGDTDALLVEPNCPGYTVAADQLGAVAMDPGADAAPTGPAVAITSVGPTRAVPDGPAIVALAADGHPIAYGDGPPPTSLAACPGSARVVTVTDPGGGVEASVTLWDTATLTPVRVELLPPSMATSQGSAATCLDADGSRLAITQVGNHARIGVRAPDGTWSVSDEHLRIAAAAVLRDPEVVVLATSDWGPKLTTVDLATLQPIGEGTLGTTGDALYGAPTADGNDAVFAVSNGLAPPGGSQPTGGRLQVVTPAGDAVHTVTFAEDIASWGTTRPLVFVGPDGALTVQLAQGNRDTIVRFEADGTRSDTEPLRVDDIDRMLWLGAGRTWTQLSTTALASLTAVDGTDRVIWPFVATAVVGLPEPTAIDPAAAERADPYAALDASFAVAAGPEPEPASDDRRPWALALGIVLIGAGAVGLTVAAARRSRDGRTST